MKNYDEMSADVFRRIDEYQAERKRKRNRCIQAAGGLCCVCLAALLGIGAWRGGWLTKTPSQTTSQASLTAKKSAEADSAVQSQQYQAYTTSEISSSVSQGDGMVDIAGMVIVDGITYVQYGVQCGDEKAWFTPDRCLGDASNFEGYYQEYKSEERSAVLYTVKESPNVLLVVFMKDDVAVVLGRHGELVVKGSVYFPSWENTDAYTPEQFIGTAKEYEIITVPYRNTTITPQDEIWTVKEDDSILLVKQSDGNTVVYRNEAEAALQTKTENSKCFVLP